MEVAFIILHSGQPREILLSTALIRCIKTQVDGAFVYSLIREEFRWLLESNPHIDGIFTYRKAPEEVLDPMRDLLADYLIDLNGGREVRRFKNRLKVLDFTIRLGPDPDTWTERAFATCSLFDVSDDHAGPQLDADDRYLGLLPGSFHDGYLVLSLDRLSLARTIPEEQIIEMVVMTEKPMVVTGSKDDRTLADRIGQSTGCAVFPTCGDLSPAEILSIQKHANGMIAFDPFWGEAAEAMRIKSRLLCAPVSATQLKDIALWGRSLFHPTHGRNSS